MSHKEQVAMETESWLKGPFGRLSSDLRLSGVTSADVQLLRNVTGSTPAALNI